LPHLHLPANLWRLRSHLRRHPQHGRDFLRPVPTVWLSNISLWRNGRFRGRRCSLSPSPAHPRPRCDRRRARLIQPACPKPQSPGPTARVPLADPGYPRLSPLDNDSRPALLPQVLQPFSKRASDRRQKGPL